MSRRRPARAKNRPEAEAHLSAATEGENPQGREVIHLGLDVAGVPRDDLRRPALGLDGDEREVLGRVNVAE